MNDPDALRPKCQESIREVLQTGGPPSGGRNGDSQLSRVLLRPGPALRPSEAHLVLREADATAPMAPTLGSPFFFRHRTWALWDGFQD